MEPPFQNRDVEEDAPSSSGVVLSGIEGEDSVHNAAGESASSATSTPAANPARMIIALYLGLVGFVGVALLLYGTKYLGVGPTIFDLPSRDLYVLSLMLAVTPILSAIFQRTPILFLLPPIALIFLLYPLFSPFGLPYDRDAIYNLQFASVLLQTNHWVPGGGVTGIAIPYSYYPASGVYNAEFSSMTGVPLPTTMLWSVPILRLLVLPPAIYALAQRLFSSRAGMLALLLFMGTPSQLFNISVQQEFAVPFLALTILLLAFVVVRPSVSSPGVMVALVLCSTFIVFSHSLTSYVTAIWLGGFLVLALVLARREPTRWVKVIPAIAIYLTVFFVYTYFVTGPLFVAEAADLGASTSSLFHLGASQVSPAGAGIGQSFQPYQQAWVYSSFFLILLISLAGLWSSRGTRNWGFARINSIIALAVAIGSLPLLLTAFAWVVERVMEFSGLLLAPLAAWWLLERFRRHPIQSRVSMGPSHLAPKSRWHQYAAPVIALAIVALIFTGGSLAPYSSRDVFAPTSEILNDSPVLIDQNDYALGIWAHAHFNLSSPVWGDYYTYSVIGGFGRFNVSYNAYLVFNGTNVTQAAWDYLRLGEYIVVDQYMTTKTPTFFGPANDQPKGPLAIAQVTKFNNPSYFDRIYSDLGFTIYIVTHLG